MALVSLIGFNCADQSHLGLHTLILSRAILVPSQAAAPCLSYACDQLSS